MKKDEDRKMKQSRVIQFLGDMKKAAGRAVLLFLESVAAWNKKVEPI